MRVSLGTGALVCWAAGLGVASVVGVYGMPGPCGDKIDDEGWCGETLEEVEEARVGPQADHVSHDQGQCEGSAGRGKGRRERQQAVEGMVLEVALWRGGGLLFWVALAQDPVGEEPICVVLGKRLITELNWVPDVGSDTVIEGEWRVHKRVTCLHPRRPEQVRSGAHNAADSLEMGKVKAP